MYSATTHVGDARTSCIEILSPPSNMEDMIWLVFETGVEEEEAITSDDAIGDFKLRRTGSMESVLYWYCLLPTPNIKTIIYPSAKRRVSSPAPFAFQTSRIYRCAHRRDIKIWYHRSTFKMAPTTKIAVFSLASTPALWTRKTRYGTLENSSSYPPGQICSGPTC